MRVKAMFPNFFTDTAVVDIGSLDINGNNKYLFSGGSYTGVDVVEGKNVDVVCPGHEFSPSAQCAVVISTECFEHDMHYEATLKNCVRILKPGGLLMFTCATVGRPEHGTERTTPSDSGTTSIGDEAWGNYYKNLTEGDIKNALDLDTIFSSYAFEVNCSPNDLYFWGVTKT